MSDPHSPEPARWILEMFAPDIPAWNRAFNELERKPLSALEDMLVHSFDNYLRRKGYLTKEQVEVLQNIATKYDVSLPLIPKSSNPLELTEGLHVKEEGRLEVVKPEILAKWRKWGVPEDIILKAIRQRQRIRQLREAEEWITLPNFAYKMPRLPQVEAQPWGTAKAIDFEGYIAVCKLYVADKIRKIDRWLYRWEYCRPRLTLKTRTYNITEEIANMWHTIVTIRYAWDNRTKRYELEYETHSASARAVRICYLTEPYLTHPEKKARASQILQTYRERPSTPRSR